MDRRGERKKRIRGTRASRHATKRVTEEPGITTPSQDRLVWRFGRLDHDGDFGWHTLELCDVKGLEREITSFQEIPIQELLRLDWLKFIPAKDMTMDGRNRLVEISSEGSDDEGLWQLHLHRDKWRVWGYFDDPEFSFLWWDKHHAVATGASRRTRKRR